MMLHIPAGLIAFAALMVALIGAPMALLLFMSQAPRRGLACTGLTVIAVWLVTVFGAAP